MNKYRVDFRFFHSDRNKKSRGDTKCWLMPAALVILIKKKK